MRYRALLLSSTAFSALMSMAVTPGTAADFSEPVPLPESLPAVSAPNAKFDFRGGAEDGFAVFMGTGSVTVPVSHSWGFQGDAMVGSLDGNLMGAVGAHLFWRDPSTGLLGIYGDVGAVDGGLSNTISRIAGEGELYLDNFTIRALIGGQFGDSDGFFDKVTLSYYPTPDLELYIGHRFLPDRGNFGAVGLEYLFTPLAAPQISFYAEGRFGEDGYSAGYGGLRFYFGPPKPLMNRDREDDPPTHFDLFVSGASFVPPIVEE